MATSIEKISIETIQFETGNSMVHVSGEVMQDNFRFQTKWILDYTDLNVILAKMRQQMEDAVFDNLFEQVELSNGNSFYSFDSSKLINEQIWLENIFFSHQPKQIRA